MTNDERKSGFESSYDGTPPWDIGRAQPAFVDLINGGAIKGDVLDVGCGTGEDALYFAEHGHEVTGIDAVESAIARAREKARDRDLDVSFLVHDAYRLADLDRTFDTVTDCGLFHVLAHDDPAAYAASLRAALAPSGRLFILGFNTRDEGQGPSISRATIHTTFSDGWEVEEIRDAAFETTNVENHKHHAWLASISPL